MLSVWVLSTQQHSTPCRLHLPTELAKQRVLLLSRQALIQNHWHVVPAQVIAETLFKWNGIDKGLWIQRLLADLYYNISYINLAFFFLVYPLFNKVAFKNNKYIRFFVVVIVVGFFGFFCKDIYVSYLRPYSSGRSSSFKCTLLLLTVIFLASV